MSRIPLDGQDQGDLGFVVFIAGHRCSATLSYCAAIGCVRKESDGLFKNIRRHAEAEDHRAGTDTRSTKVCETKSFRCVRPHAEDVDHAIETALAEAFGNGRDTEVPPP